MLSMTSLRRQTSVMTDVHRCQGSRGRIYNKRGWEEESVKGDFWRTPCQQKVLKCRKELAERKKAKERAAQGTKVRKAWLEAIDISMILL